MAELQALQEEVAFRRSLEEQVTRDKAQTFSKMQELQKQYDQQVQQQRILDHQAKAIETARQQAGLKNRSSMERIGAQAQLLEERREEIEL